MMNCSVLDRPPRKTRAIIREHPLHSVMEFSYLGVNVLRLVLYFIFIFKIQIQKKNRSFICPVYFGKRPTGSFVSAMVYCVTEF